MIKTSRFVTLTASVESVLDLTIANYSAWPSQLTFLARNALGEVAYSIEIVPQQGGQAFPALAAVPTNGAYLLPAVAGYVSQPVGIGAYSPSANIRVHLYATTASTVGIIAE